MNTRKTTSDIDRHRIIDNYLEGISVTEISRILAIKRTTVIGVIKRFLNNGIVEAHSRGKRPSKLTEEQKRTIISWIDSDFTVSLKRLVQKIDNVFGVSISKSTIARIIKTFHYSLKRLNLIPERRNDPRTISLRCEYAQRFITLASVYAENQIIYIDEVGFNASMRTSRGRSLIGSPATLTVPSIRSRNISICCAMNIDGIILYETKNSAYNTESFSMFIANLIAQLRTFRMMSAIFIFDNVSFHKAEVVRELICREGYALDYLPPYSPFLNPIENMFSEWKESVKRSNPRDENTLINNIATGAGLISQSDCIGFYRHMISYIPRCINNEVIED
jgi:transposase